MNILWLLGKYYATQAGEVSGAVLVDLKVTTDFLKKRLDIMFEEVQNRLALFTRYEEVDWRGKFEKPG